MNKSRTFISRNNKYNHNGKIPKKYIEYIIINFEDKFSQLDGIIDLKIKSTFIINLNIFDDISKSNNYNSK